MEREFFGGVPIFGSVAPILPVIIINEPFDLYRVYREVMPPWKSHNSAIVYLLSVEKPLRYTQSNGYSIREYVVATDTCGDSEFIKFKKDLALDILHIIKRHESQIIRIPVITNDIDLLCYFIMRWLMEERSFTEQEATTAIKEITGERSVEQKYRMSLANFYGSHWPPLPSPEFPPVDRFSAVKGTLTLHSLEKRLEDANSREIGAEICASLHQLGIIPVIPVPKRLTKSVIKSEISANFRILMEPAGQKCICIFESDSTKLYIPRDQVGIVMNKGLGLKGTVAEAVLADDGSLIITDVYIVNSENVSRMSFEGRISAIEKCMTNAHSTVKLARMCALSEVGNVCKDRSLRGFSLVNTAAPDTRYFWKFGNHNVVTVMLRVSFMGDNMIGHVIRVPSMVPVVDLGAVDDRFKRYDGEPVKVEITGGTTELDTYKLLKGRIIAQDDSVGNICTYQEFQELYNGNERAMSEMEMIDLLTQ